MEWWGYLLIWWGGMVPQAFIVGRLEREYVKQAKKPLTDFVRFIAIGAWPLVWACMPLVVAFIAGGAAKKKRERDAGDA